MMRQEVTKKQPCSCCEKAAAKKWLRDTWRAQLGDRRFRGIGMARRTLLLLLACAPSHSLRPPAAAARAPRRRPPLASAAERGQAPLPAEPSSLLPFLVLNTVPIVWGTYGVAIKSLYALDAPPPEVSLTFANYVVSALAVSAASLAFGRPAADSPADASAAAPPAGLTARAGAELGGYLFLASTLQVFGMRYTSATRGAFLVQLTTVFTPLLEVPSPPSTS